MDKSTRFESALRAGFQHCSTGLTCGEYFGKLKSLNVLQCKLKNSSTILPWWHGPLSTNKQTLPQRFNSFSKNLTNAFWFFLLENKNTKERWASCSKHVGALVFAVYNYSRMAASSAPAAAYYGQQPKGRFIFTTNYKPFLSIIAHQPGNFFLKRSISCASGALRCLGLGLCKENPKAFNSSHTCTVV